VSPVRPSVCRLSVTFVHPTQVVVICGNYSPAFGTLALALKYVLRPNRGQVWS